MSRRTSEANKAIAAKWNKEQQLVKEGKGTRDWTQEQQKDILEKGKAYDENGLAFEGQHMKSVEAFPEHQGNPDNIQFLTKQEHLEAHGGNWQNPTNGYFNPVTRQMIEFEKNNLVPCSIIHLSDPIVSNLYVENIKNSDVSEFEITKEEHQIDNANIPTNKNLSKNKDIKHFFESALTTVKERATNLKLSINNFSEQHPIAINIARVLGVYFIKEGTSVLINKTINNTSSNSHSNNETYAANISDQINSNNSDFTNVRATPNEHIVRAHGQHYGKNKVWVEKQPYTRGKNN